MYELWWSNQAKRDYKVVKQSKHMSKVNEILRVLEEDPFEKSYGFKKMKGHKNTYVRDINDQHRVVYEIFLDGGAVKIVSLWTHYESGKKL